MLLICLLIFSLHLDSFVLLLKDMLLVVVSDCFLNPKKTCFESGYLVVQYLNSSIFSDGFCYGGCYVGEGG